jgi:hypothetical protein
MIQYKFRLSDEEYAQCEYFAKESAKTQRPNRSGGAKERTVQEITSDTFRGKVGEFVVKKFLEQAPLTVSEIELDFKIYPRGEWDEGDITINSVKLSVKSIKHFARWLLLESKDILRDVYDYYILVLIDEDFKAGTLAGFAFKQEIVSPNPNTILLLQGQLIPGTPTILDADNHARHSKYLHNSEEDWVALANKLKP